MKVYSPVVCCYFGELEDVEDNKIMAPDYNME